MYIKSFFKGVVLNNLRIIGAVLTCATLSIFTNPALASTISGAPVNIHVGDPGDWVPDWAVD